MSKPSDIVTIALAEVGYREKASNASLDDKTADRKSTRLNSSHPTTSRMPSSA